MFLKEQIKNANVVENARRYHPDFMRRAIDLYCRSPSAYEHIRNSEVLALPAPCTIRSYR